MIEPTEIPAMGARWEAMLRGESALANVHRFGRHAFGLFPSPWRCKFCNAPFKGPGAGIVRWVGYAPSRKNPSICARCIEHAPEGGAVVPLSVLFADVRGYTALGEHLDSVGLTSFVMRFYATASKVLLAHNGLLAQISGDEVMALFVPGLAGRDYRGSAVAGAVELLEAIDDGNVVGEPLQVGVGVASGEEYVGNVGGGGFKDFTAIGDVTNTAARLTAVAAAGEILVDRMTYAAVAPTYPEAPARGLALKGKSDSITAFQIASRPTP
jgi:adenylate cyclase